MFNISTKVAVLASSNTKNIGPKYGSIGYAAVDGSMQYSPYLLNPSTTDGIMLASSKVMFTRYGFGKERPKYEYKRILNVFPIIDKSVKIEDIEQTVSKVVSKFKREDFGNRFWLNAKMNFIGSTEANVCIMAPVLALGTDLRTCSNLEFIAWFHSMLNIHGMKNSIAKINNKQYLDNLPSKESRPIAISLRHCVSDGKYKLRYLDEIIDSSKTRAPVVEFLKLIHSITKAVPEEYIRKRTMARFRNGEYGYSKGKPDGKALFFKAIVYDIFSDYAFEAIRQMVPKGTMSTITARVGHTKRIFELMALGVAKKNGEWNHLHTERRQ